MFKFKRPFLLTILFTFFLFSLIFSSVYAQISSEVTSSNTTEAPRVLTITANKGSFFADSKDTIQITVTLVEKITFQPLEATITPTQVETSPVANSKLIFELSPQEGFSLQKTSEATDKTGTLRATLSGTTMGQASLTVRDPETKIYAKAEDASVSILLQAVTPVKSAPPKTETGLARKLELDFSEGLPTDLGNMSGHGGEAISLNFPPDWNIFEATISLTCRSRSSPDRVLSFGLELTQSLAGGGVFTGSLDRDVYAILGGNSDCEVTITPTSSDAGLTFEPLHTKIALIDPFGTVSDANTKKPIPDVKVTLYAKENEKWIVWPAKNFENQVNPQLTDKYGKYSFFTPPGEYYLTFQKNGYRSYKSDSFSVIDEPVRQDAELVPISQGSYLLYLGVGLVIGILLSGLAFLILRKKGRI